MSKIVKRIKEQKFTSKRSPYKRYQKSNWKWDDIFMEIDLLKETMAIGFIKYISEKYGIKYKTLKNKYNNYKNSPKINNINDENRGCTNKIFTETEEQKIFNYLKENFINKNKMLRNEIIKLYTIQECKKLHPNIIFKASNGWINMFKKGGI